MPRKTEDTRILTREEREALLVKDASGVTLFDRSACQHCGGLHLRKCPKIKIIEFHPNNAVARVEFWPWNEWPMDDVIWPESVYDDYEDLESTT